MAIEFDDESSAPAGNGSIVFDDDDNAPKSFLGKTVSNIIPDLGETATGIGSAIKEGAYDMPKRALETGLEMSAGKPYAETPSGKKDVELVEHAPEQAAAMARPITHPIDYFSEHPVQQTLNLMGAAELGKGLLGDVPHGTIPSEVTPEAPPAPVPKATELPVMQPGSKTGDPHALFSYNDKFGPGGADRSLYNVFGDPEHPAVKQTGFGSSVTKADLDKAGIPVVGREPRSVGKWDPIEEPKLVDMGTKGPTPEPASRIPPDPNAPPPVKPSPKSDPLQDVKDWMASKGQKIAQKPGIVQKIGNYLGEESAKLGGKDIGLQLGQLKSMGPGFQGLEKGKQLISYAREKGYLDPSLSDTSRRAAVESNMEKAGSQLGGLREISNKRGTPPLAQMRDSLNKQLTDKFGIDAPGEVNKVLAKFDKRAKEDPTFTGMADLATDLHAQATPATKMGLHPGPTTEGANILARMNNDATRATLNPEEGKMFTDSLRDFGAHKKLEQALSAGGRKALVGRGAPGSATNRLIQEGLDRGGYRLGGNMANKVAGWTKANPKATLPQFFEELAHQSDQSVDDAIQGMSKGGVVPNDVKQWVSSKGC
jgi:hypothetical protein